MNVTKNYFHKFKFYLSHTHTHTHTQIYTVNVKIDAYDLSTVMDKQNRFYGK